MSQPSDSSPPDWAVQQAQTALRGGMSAPEVEYRLVAVGLAPQVAKDVVSRAGGKPSEPPPMMGWAMEHARAALRAGLKVPDIERQLVSKGLTPEIAEVVVTNVLGERVRAGQPVTPEAQRRRNVHWIASGVAAGVVILLGYLFGGGYSALVAFAWLVTPVAMIWFADVPVFRRRFSERGPVPAIAIRWSGWFLLALYFLYRLELVLVKKSFQNPL